MKNVKTKWMIQAWINSTVSKVFTLHNTNLELIP